MISLVPGGVSGVEGGVRLVRENARKLTFLVKQIRGMETDPLTRRTPKYALASHSPALHSLHFNLTQLGYHLARQHRITNPKNNQVVYGTITAA